MQTSLKIAAAVCTGSLLAGCAAPLQFADLRIEPKTDVRHSGESAAAYYAVGRYYQGSRRIDQAIKAYRRALVLDSGHMPSRSALSSLLAEKGDIGQAVSVLREAPATAQRDSRFYNNLGYALTLKGDYDEAEKILDHATRADPGNATAWNNFARVLEIQGKAERAQALYARARSLREQEAAPARAQAPAAPALPTQDSGAGAGIRRDATKDVPSNQETRPFSGLRTEVHQVVPGLYEVRLASSQPNGAIVSAPVSVHKADAGAGLRVASMRVDAPGPRYARIEISNGNGVTSMAKAVGHIINGARLRVTWLTNQAHFNVHRSRIEYADGFESIARSLAAGLGHSTELAVRTDMNGRDIRLILGHDMTDVASIRAHFPGTSRIAEKKRDPQS